MNVLGHLKRIRKPLPLSFRARERSVAVLIRPSEYQPDWFIRITQDGTQAHYWVSVVPSDKGPCFRLDKPGWEGDASYTVQLETDGHSCTCPGFRSHGRCKHSAGIRALITAGKLA